MMVLSALRPDASLPEFLAHRAKSASVRRLAIDVAAGLIIVASVGWWRPWAWIVVASAALCVASYGGWGLLDRARSAQTRGAALGAGIQILSALLVAVGVVSAATLLYAIWSLALGTWIS
jgi:hypothetical protein